jgi:hypothetical protein
VDQGPRYAIYFVPAADSKIYRYGSSILGYDCYSGQPVDFPEEFGQESDNGAVNWNELTAAPRRYGFHATLKAPFYRSPACSENQLVNALQNFAGLGHAVHRFAPTVRLLNRFFAIVPLKAATSLSRRQPRSIRWRRRARRSSMPIARRCRRRNARSA